MAIKKRFYWLKLKETFFDDDIADFLENQDNGKDYLIFYLKLCCKSLKNDGVLTQCIGETSKPYDNIGLARITHTKIKIVESALKLFEEIGIIERLSTGEIFLTQIPEMVGSESEGAERKRQQRIRDKIKRDNVTTLSQESHTETEKETELEKELELNCLDCDGKPSPDVPSLEEIFNFYHLQKLAISPIDFYKRGLKTDWSDNEGQPLENWKGAYIAMCKEWATPSDNYNEDLTLEDVYSQLDTITN